MSDTDLVTIRLLRMAMLLGATGWLLYVLLGWRPAGASSDFAQTSALLGATPVGLGLTDLSGLLRYANPLFLRMLDLSPVVIGQIDLESMVRGRLVSGTPASLLSGAGRSDAVVHIRYANGRAVDLQLAIAPITAAGQEGYVLFVTDVTASRRAAEKGALHSQILEALQAGIVLCDASRPSFPMTYVNAKFQQTSGYDLSELLGSPCSMLQGTDRNQPGALRLAEVLARQQTGTVQLRNYRKSGESYSVEMAVSPIFDGQGRLTHYIGLQQDVTADQNEAMRLAGELYNDIITSALSRAGFVRGVTGLLDDPANTCVLLVRVDLQSFHEFNTALGWNIGDTLLEEVALRLRRVVPGAIVGRLESNQFGLAVSVAASKAAALATQVNDALQGRYVLPGATCEPVFAIGWTVGLTGVGSRLLMQQSSVALNEARASRTGTIRQYDAGMEAKILERRRLTAELKQAIRDGDFIVHYQPRVDLRTRRIVAAEAFMRWDHPLFGLQWPIRFVALAEETGLIIEIGEFSLMQAAQVAALINHRRAVAVPISVNVSFAQFRRRNFVRLIETALAQAHASPAWLQLELTENIYTASTPDMLATLHQLSAMGIGLVIDDFAAGYTSLRYFANEPVDEIKIDRSFIAGLEDDGVARAAIQSILSLAEAKNARVTAEAVETERQREILLELGCTMAQGFLFSPPVPQDEFLALLERDDAESGHDQLAPV